MLKKHQWSFIFSFILVSIIAFASCEKEQLIPIPNTFVFEQNLSEYNIFQGTANDLIPSNDYHLLELSSSLFVNYAEKQRLIKLPSGSSMVKIDDDLPDFPEQTILVKTFYYYNDVRDPALGKKIIETRLFVKAEGLWNVATYIWNAAQTEAILDLSGVDLNVSWINANGNNKSIQYHVPSANECVTCHQSNFEVIPLGPKLMNMNFDVTRNGAIVNQLDHFQILGIINSFNSQQLGSLPDYNNTNNSVTERGRAYLEMNCSHCHQPNGYGKAAKKGMDFRYGIYLNQTKIIDKKDKISEEMQKGEMPYLGTTVLDQEGYSLMIDFLNGL